MSIVVYLSFGDVAVSGPSWRGNIATEHVFQPDTRAGSSLPCGRTDQVNAAPVSRAISPIVKNETAPGASNDVAD